MAGRSNVGSKTGVAASPAVCGSSHPVAVQTLTLTSPAKINLMLAVTGRRPDGFHELVSVVAPLAWGDALTVEVEEGAQEAESRKENAESRGPKAESRGQTEHGGGKERSGAQPQFVLACEDPAVPLDESNLVLKAARAFADATGWSGAAHFTLEKRIPLAAGLGGGSSNAAATLEALNRLLGTPLTRAELAGIAAGVGSDCALFLAGAPVVMRGRGERIEPLEAAAAGRVRGRSVLVFKPAFGVATAWAYGRLAAAAPASYVATADAEARLAGWIAQCGSARAEAADGIGGLLFNNMEPPVFAKFPALPLLFEKLRLDFGLEPRMSGSGSACFALLPDGAPVPVIEAAIRHAWGDSAFVVRTCFA